MLIVGEPFRKKVEDPTRNMYGCFPCPKCESVYRYGTQDGLIVCDDCGYNIVEKPKFFWDTAVR